MKNLKQIWFILALTVGIFLLYGCGGDDDVVEPTEPPPPAANLFGAPVSLFNDLGAEDSAFVDAYMLLFWTDADSGNTGSYNIYRKIDDGDPVKLNSSWVEASPLGPEDYHPKTLWFADTTYDSTSAQTYRYFVKAVSGNGESAAADTVTCVPNSIDSHNGISNMWPSDMSEIGLNPTFTWDAKTGATSYVMMLINDPDRADYWPWWFHRVTTTQCAFKSTPGATYLDVSESMLYDNQAYAWVLCAINDNNCGFAMSAADFVTLNPSFMLMLVTGSVDAGRYRYCWDQKDISGFQVAPGTYGVHMTSGAFDTTITFNISGTQLPPSVVQDCDEDFGGLLPASFALSLDSDFHGYLVGDTVKITYDMPDTAIVQIRIEH